MFRALLIACLLAFGIHGPQQPAAPAAPAPPPGTDIYELPFDGTVDALKRAKPSIISAERGYENQPYYSPDGGAILFTANRNGKQTDIYEFDRKSRKTRQLTNTSEGEFSPTFTPDGSGFSVIRVESDGTQRLWRFDRNGANPRIVLNDVKPVGYHAWIDADTIALYVLGKPSTLQLARISTGKAEILTRDIGRSLQRIPDSPAISFVQREDGEFWVKRLDGSSGAITRIVRAAPDSTDRDCVWLADGTLLMSVGTRIFAYPVSPAIIPPGQNPWREVLDVAAHKLGNVTRLAIAPDGKALAIVVSE